MTIELAKMKLTAGEEYTRKLGNKQGQANADWCYESALVLLCGEHKDGEDELGSKEHLDDCSMLVFCLQSCSITCLQSPRATDVPLLRVVETLSGPGNSADTTAEAQMLPRI